MADLENKKLEAEKKTNEVEKQEALAVVYQTWTDSLDRQVSSLNKQLESTATEEAKTQLQNKIDEVKSSAEEKRQKAADSRNKVDNLKLQAALASASTVSSETSTAPANTVSSQTTTSTGSISPENLQGTENINNYYADKLKQNEKITNEYEKKSKDQVLYQDWSSSLYDESQRLKKDGQTEKADEAENSSKAKQLLAVQTAGEVTQIKYEHPELIANANLTATETKNENETSTQPVKTTSGVSTEPVTSTPVTNTITATNPVQTEPATPSTSSSTQAPNTNTQAGTTITNQTANLPLSTEAPVSVNNKDAYTHYVALKNESNWAKKNAERLLSQSEDIRKISDKQFDESQAASEQIPNTQDPNERQKLKEKSDALDLLALANLAKADSIKNVAKNSEAEANSKQTESDLYLQSLDKADYEEITAATGNKTNAETTTANNTGTTTKTETLAQNSNPSAITETGEIKNETTKTTVAPSTAEISTENINTATKTEPTKTETGQNKTTNTNTETSSQPLKNETTANNTESSKPFKPFRPTPNSFTPFPSQPQSASTPPPPSPSATKSSAEILKYYDALFDKLEFEGSSYSASKPIPVDAPMPDGLIFKVQIGAFKNPIPQDLFKGIKPITAETTPQGLMRYTVGIFEV